MRTDNIIASLVNTERYSEELETVPHIKVHNLGLSIVFRTIIVTPDGKVSSDVIDYNMAYKLKLTNLEELYNLAIDNIIKTMPTVTESLGNNIYVMSNEKGLFGAVGMLITKGLKSLADIYTRSLFIIPSSIHEVYILPDIGQDKDALKSILEVGNNHIVNEQDFLSDSIYYYDYNKKIIIRK